ncbi:hypothetical protein EMCG_06245 [[Emmonsia] crescens]|uniref:Uncharacterized protein n=1 Tax=[Emmonsia] crescens TaxID=73230 RepID=A0A0G2ICN5_9EURO|nr:hypothetical protein EMCG_06245 [Emmonsia crescens UAMH 3008]
MEKPPEQPLLNKEDQYERACICIDILIKQKKLSVDGGEVFRIGMKLCDRIARTYHLISDFPTCYFQAEHTLVKEDFDVITDVEPIFFSRMPLADFELYKFEPLKSHRIFDEKSASEYCQFANYDLCELLRNSLESPDTVPLTEYGGWHDEMSKRNVRMPHELPGWQPSAERYEWQALGIKGREDVPHTIISSYHNTHSPAHILRGELLTILRVMWWKTKVVLGKGHEITPILLISVRPYCFRVIEAYYNGSKFVLRYSKPVAMKLTDSMEERQKACNWVIRWNFSTPVGDTRNLGALRSSNLQSKS